MRPTRRVSWLGFGGWELYVSHEEYADHIEGRSAFRQYKRGVDATGTEGWEWQWKAPFGRHVYVTRMGYAGGPKCP